jgi:hypothetical protein
MNKRGVELCNTTGTNLWMCRKTMRNRSGRGVTTGCGVRVLARPCEGRRLTLHARAPRSAVGSSHVDPKL